MTRRSLAIVALAGACTWIDDEADRARRDNDGDGLSLLDDCNDDDASLGTLSAADDTVTCGDRVTASVQGPDRLTTSTCVHPLGTGEELLTYGPREDLWALDLAADAEVVVQLVPAAGFSQAAAGADDDDEGDDVDTAGAVLWAWPEGPCPRAHCTVGLPLVDPETGTLQGRADPVVRFAARAGERWVLVVSATAGSGYELVVDCSP